MCCMYTGLVHCFALSWSHDAWALIALIAFFVRHIGARKYMGFLVLLMREGTSKNHIFTNVSHVLDHNNIYI